MTTFEKVGHLAADVEAIRVYSEKHKLAEFSIFGSALRDDFRPDSDVDVLFELVPGEMSSIELYMEMEEELRAMFGRNIDLVRRSCIRNTFRRHHILTTRRKLYVRPAA